jgi:hypothetical protein
VSEPVEQCVCRAVPVEDEATGLVHWFHRRDCPSLALLEALRRADLLSDEGIQWLAHEREEPE